MISLKEVKNLKGLDKLYFYLSCGAFALSIFILIFMLCKFVLALAFIYLVLVLAYAVAILVLEILKGSKKGNKAKKAKK